MRDDEGELNYRKLPIAELDNLADEGDDEALAELDRRWHAAKAAKRARSER